MEDLNKYYIIVEEGIRQAGVDPELCRSNSEGQWNLKRGNTELWVDLWYVEEENHTYFQVMTPLVSLPDENKEVFYRELLDLNYQMISACFVTYKDGVYIKITKEAETLSPEELVLCLSRVGYYGEVFEEGFIRKFQAKKLEHID
jgi:hypothetical protein